MLAGLDRGGVAVALRRVGSVVVLGLLPVVLTGAVLGSTLGGRSFLFDYHGDLYSAGRAIIQGDDPYRPGFLEREARLTSAGDAAPTKFAVPVYPAPALLIATPLSFLPFKLAGFVFTLLAVTAMIIGLRLLGVRDWRCWGLAALSWPVLYSVRLGQVNEFLIFGLACVWRWRAHTYKPALALASITVLKLFVWPVGVILALERRFRVVVISAVAALLGTLASWATIGFDGMTAYPRMLLNLSTVEGGAGVSLASVGRALDVSRGVAETTGLLAAVALLGLALRLKPGSCRDRRAFALAVMATLAASPIVWPHYLTLVFVPIALISPTLSPLWCVPLIAYLAPVAQTNGDIWKIAPYLAIELLTIAAILGRRSWSFANLSRQTVRTAQAANASGTPSPD